MQNNFCRIPAGLPYSWWLTLLIASTGGSVTVVEDSSEDFTTISPQDEAFLAQDEFETEEEKEDEVTETTISSVENEESVTINYDPEELVTEFAQEDDDDTDYKQGM